MRVLPYFLAGAIPEQPDRTASARPQDRPYFLFVGRLTRLKGLESVIPVFGRYPQADLLIIGDGEHGPALQALAKPVPNVKFLGRLPNQELGRYYEHAIAAIVPSQGYETFGIVLIEALRTGTPVIARRLGPFPEIVEQSGGGLLFSTADELLEAMKRLQDDAAFRDGLAASGYRACREHWSEQVVIDRFLGLVSEARDERLAETRQARVTVQP
jgi:glycosyltransferase involved in cell wall biosynthesis